MSINEEKQHDTDALINMRNDLRVAKSSEDNQIDLLELASVVLANIRWVIAAVLLFAVVTFAFTRYYMTPIYRATGSMYVVNSKSTGASVGDFQVGNYLASDYEKVIYTWAVLQQTSDSLNLGYSYEKLRSMVRVVNPASTRILEISVDSPNPQEAASIANELMNVVRSYAVNVMEIEKPNILSEARVPTQRYSPSIMRNTVLGAVLGGLISVLMIFVFFILDDKVKTPDDTLKHAGLHTLAVIPRPFENELPPSKRGSSKRSKIPKQST